VKDQKWKWLTPGAVIGVLLWVVASIGMRAYLHHFNSYAKTYGSVGAVVILMLWFYVTAFSMLIGAEINAEIENAAAEQGRADAKMKGENHAPAA
jgi:membrane protein